MIVQFATTTDSSKLQHLVEWRYNHQLSARAEYLDVTIRPNMLEALVAVNHLLGRSLDLRAFILRLSDWENIFNQVSFRIVQVEINYINQSQENLTDHCNAVEHLPHLQMTRIDILLDCSDDEVFATLPITTPLRWIAIGESVFRRGEEEFWRRDGTIVQFEAALKMFA